MGKFKARCLERVVEILPRQFRVTIDRDYQVGLVSVRWPRSWSAPSARPRTVLGRSAAIDNRAFRVVRQCRAGTSSASFRGPEPLKGMNMQSKGTHTSVRIRREVYIDTDEGIRWRVVTFDGLPDGKQHVAWVYGDLQAPGAALPLVRVHSECHTGDLWQSLCCDCGCQRAEARLRCQIEGRGVVLYMEDEGRGIGLYEKIEAYHLQQERGLNTYEANEALGHPAESRDLTVAAQMIKALGLTAIRLHTNNPEKVEALQGEGLTVEQVTTATYVTKQNRKYLEDKKNITNHRLDLDQPHRLNLGDK